MATVQADLDQVEAGFDRALFEKVLGAGRLVRVTRFEGLENDAIFEVEFGAGPLSGRWVGQIERKIRDPNEIAYTDVGIELPKPLRTWRHRHRLLRRLKGGTFIRDEIEFSTGTRTGDWALYPVLMGLILARRPIYKAAFGELS